MQFDNLGLDGSILRAIKKKGYETATPIQAQAIPHVLEGKDLIACAQTGTGKTAAFSLPILHRLRLSGEPTQPQRTGGRPGPARRVRRKIRSLVLSPTRELTVQIADSVWAYGRYAGLKHVVIYGGVSQGPQVRKLREGVDIVIATPGRLIDLIEQGHVDLSAVEMLTFDEADLMLDMGFIQELKRIVRYVPAERQTLMFSATMPPAIRELASEWLRNPVRIQAAPQSTPAENVEQSVYIVDRRSKPELLESLLKRTGRSLVFSRTKHGADNIVRRLKKAGIEAAAIHGDKSQAARQRVLRQFKSDILGVLVATDVAARGLDIPEVSHVINYDLPETPEIYVHRIGRTARAGASGFAVSLCGFDERGQLKAIERTIKKQIAVETRLPDGTDCPTPPPTREERPRRAPQSSPRGPKQGQANGAQRRYSRPGKKGPKRPGASRGPAKAKRQGRRPAA